MVQLNPTDEELCYMLCHLCFQQISKQCDGQILEAVEQFQDSISNHLHDYYLNHLSRPNYSGRIAALMKLNSIAQVFYIKPCLEKTLKFPAIHLPRPNKCGDFESVRSVFCKLFPSGIIYELPITNS